MTLKCQSEPIVLDTSHIKKIQQKPLTRKMFKEFIFYLIHLLNIIAQAADSGVQIYEEFF